jgi:hypothetical protein
MTKSGVHSSAEDGASIPTEIGGWGWWASTDEETFTVGPEATRDNILDVARDSYDGEGFFIVEAIQGSADNLIPSAERIVCDALENAADNGVFGEDGDYDLRGRPEVCDAALAELDAALKVWVAKWGHLFPKPWAFAKTRNAEWVDPSSLPTAGHEAEGEASPTPSKDQPHDQ